MTNDPPNQENARRAVNPDGEVREEVIDSSEGVASPAWSVMNAPLFLTITIAIFVTILSVWLMNAALNRWRYSLLHEDSYAKKLDTRDSFAADVPANLVFYCEYVKKPRMWLTRQENLAESEQGRYLDHYSYDQTMAKYHEDRRAYLETTPMEGYFALIRGTYRETDVILAVDALEAVWRRLSAEELSEKETLDELSRAFDEKFDDAVVAMSDELHTELESSQVTELRKPFMAGLAIICIGLIFTLRGVFRVWRVMKKRAAEKEARALPPDTA